jgi:hypothetical protein
VLAALGATTGGTRCEALLGHHLLGKPHPPAELHLGEARSLPGPADLHGQQHDAPRPHGLTASSASVRSSTSVPPRRYWPGPGQRQLRRGPLYVLSKDVDSAAADATLSTSLDFEVDVATDRYGGSGRLAGRCGRTGSEPSEQRHDLPTAVCRLSETSGGAGQGTDPPLAPAGRGGLGGEPRIGQRGRPHRPAAGRLVKPQNRHTLASIWTHSLHLGHRFLPRRACGEPS